DLNQCETERCPMRLAAHDGRLRGRARNAQFSLSHTLRVRRPPSAHTGWSRWMMIGAVVPPDDVAAFGQRVATVLGSVFADGFVGAYFVGSIALGGYVSGESDLDIVAVCLQEVDDAAKESLARKLAEVTTTCPACGL